MYVCVIIDTVVLLVEGQVQVTRTYPCELELFSLTVFFSNEAVTLCCNGEGTGDECLLELESALMSSSSSVGNFDIRFLFNPCTLLS